VISVHEADVTTDELKKNQYDVIIAEMIAVGLIEEQLVPAFNHVLNKGLLKPSAKAIPGIQQTYAQLVNTDFDFFGYQLVTTQIEQTWQKSPIKEEMTNKELICKVDFNQAIVEQKSIDPKVVAVIDFTATKSGKVNAIRLLSDSVLTNDIVSGWTQCMNSPAIIPFDEITVAEGEKIQVEISYEMGGEMKTYRAIRN